MLLTNLKLDKQTETPLYTQIIDSIKTSSTMTRSQPETDFRLSAGSQQRCR